MFNGRRARARRGLNAQNFWWDIGAANLAERGLANTTLTLTTPPLCRICGAQAAGGVLDLGTDFTKQALFDAGTRAALAEAGLPVRLYFGWHMTCEEVCLMTRLELKVRPAPCLGLPAPVARLYQWALVYALVEPLRRGQTWSAATAAIKLDCIGEQGMAFVILPCNIVYAHSVVASKW